MYKRSGLEMKDNELIEGLVVLHPCVVAIAVNGSSNGKCIVQWALEKFVHEDNVLFKLLHIRPKLTTVPTSSKFQFVFRFVCWKLMGDEHKNRLNIMLYRGV